MKQIKANELKKKIENNQVNVENVIDVRSTLERLMKKIKDSQHIPMHKVVSSANNKLNKETTYYIVCASGMRSSSVAKELDQLGYKVVNVTGGMSAY